jgi:hypothetical protein
MNVSIYKNEVWYSGRSEAASLFPIIILFDKPFKHGNGVKILRLCWDKP